jgi:RHS repeat-associated protein
MTVISRGGYNADNQLTLWGSQGFLYDLNGNMTADGNNAYAWNVRNQLVALTPDGGTANTFVYDAFGRRQKKVINGIETDFLFDQNGNLAAELTDGGEYFTSTDLEGFSPDELVCRYTAGVDGGLNQPLMAMTDINGSLVGLVGDGGVIQATYAYEPYGATSATGTGDGNSQQYAGRENDGTGVYYDRARYYFPEIGRFINEDPIGWQGGINIYQYAGGNPVQDNDPFGLQSVIGCAENPGACPPIEPVNPPLYEKLVKCLPFFFHKKPDNKCPSCYCFNSSGSQGSLQYDPKTGQGTPWTTQTCSQACGSGGFKCN